MAGVPKELWVTAQREPSRLEAAIESMAPKKLALAVECIALVDRLGMAGIEALRALLLRSRSRPRNSPV